MGTDVHSAAPKEQAVDTKGQACLETWCTTAKYTQSSEKEETIGGLWGGVGAAGGEMGCWQGVASLGLGSSEKV